MRTKTVQRHYCDFCSRGSFRKSATQRHEASCFRNPNRFCPICADAALKQVPMNELQAAFVDPEDLTKLREITQGCPACILSTIIQCRHMTTVAVGEDEDMDVPFMVDFKYKDEMQAFNASENRRHVSWSALY